jgi:hypothetical protein
MPVILAAQEAEIWRTAVQSQPRKIVLQDPTLEKNPSQKRAGGVAQDVGPEFKLQYHKKKKKIAELLLHLLPLICLLMLNSTSMGF